MKRMDLPCCKRAYVVKLMVNGKIVMITCMRCYTDWLVDDLYNLINFGKNINNFEEERRMMI